jgi:hypothetical protein
MTPKEKAQELVKSFEPMVNPYMGSGMLSNTYDDDAILWQSKKCAMIAVDEILNNFGLTCNGQTFFTEYRAVEFWKEVKQEIEKIQHQMSCKELLDN